MHLRVTSVSLESRSLAMAPWLMLMNLATVAIRTYYYCPASVISLRLLQWDGWSQNVAHIFVVFHIVGNNLI